MADAFLKLDAADRREALQVAAAASGRPVHLLEKDVWVVWLLDVLFRAPFGEHLVFKGGTSLSKAYGLIDRFSEDLDLTYDIRTLAPDFADPHGDGLPAAMAEARRWSRVVRERLPSWVSDTVSPFVQAALASEGLEADLVEDGDKLTVAYGPLAQGTGYAPPSVLLEFGARATGEPAEARDVVCDAAAVLPDLVFPTARPRVMKAERTFWEKATAAHVYCEQGRMRGERFSRHWYDLVRLDGAGVAGLAAADRALADAVARHKSLFFRETANGAAIDYHRAVGGHLRLVPEAAVQAALADDYRRMLEDGLLEHDAPTFEALMAICADLAERVNAAA